MKQLNDIMGITGRQQFILDRLQTQQTYSYKELTELLGVSKMTVRRDVEELSRRGAVIKTLGGVRQANALSQLYESALPARLAANVEEKRAIAECALELIGSRTAIYLDGGTTCLELARLIAQRQRGLTIITNSALLCIELGRSPHNTVIGLGGQYDSHSFSFVGPSTADIADNFHPELAFLSTKGFLPQKGTFESNAALIRVKQTIARQCGELVLLADHSKFGERALCKVLDVRQIHTVVTDDRTPRKYISDLEQGGHRVCVARVPESRNVYSSVS